MASEINTAPFNTTWADSAGGKWRIEVRYEVVNERAVPVSFTIRGDGRCELTHNVLRELPFREMVYGSRQTKAPKQRMDLIHKTEKFRDMRKHEGRRPRALSAEEAELTVEVYLDAYRTGQPTIRTIADRFGLTESGAAQRIALLRKHGMLPSNSKENRSKKRS